jgi:hypothetical protein
MKSVGPLFSDAQPNIDFGVGKREQLFEGMADDY